MAGPLRREDFTACIHCGLCLEACPTYRETLEEGLSARGRVQIMQALADGRIGSGPGDARSLDLCLLCCSCESACPSGVGYLDLVVKARSWLSQARGGRRERFVRNLLRVLFLRPRLLSLALRTVRLSARWGIASLVVRTFFVKSHRRHFLDLIASLVETPPAAGPEQPLTERDRPPAECDEPITGRARPAVELQPGSPPTQRDLQSVVIFRGCTTPVLFPQVLESMELLLRKIGVDFSYPSGQSCCGALLLHHGDVESTRKLARRNIDVFAASGSRLILVEAAGCGAILKKYGDMLADDPEYAVRARSFSARVRDVTEFLAAVVQRPRRESPEPPAAPLRVVYQDPCHLRHLQGVSEEPRLVLDSLPQIHRVAAGEEDLCCGSAGIYNLLEPEMSAGLADRKVEMLAATGADLVVTANPGCRLQLEGRLRRRGLAIRHIVEICERFWFDGHGPERTREGRPPK